MVCFYLYFYDKEGNRIDREEVFKDRDDNRIHNPDDCTFYNMDIIKKELTPSGRSEEGFDGDCYYYSLEDIMSALVKTVIKRPGTATWKEIEYFEQTFKEVYQVAQLVSVAHQYNLLLEERKLGEQQIEYLAFGYD